MNPSKIIFARQSECPLGTIDAILAYLTFLYLRHTRSGADVLSCLQCIFPGTERSWVNYTPRKWLVLFFEQSARLWRGWGKGRPFARTLAREGQGS